jgi:cell fate regulator YaaT (PSP1 superfamily)
MSTQQQLTVRFGTRKATGRFLAHQLALRVGDRCVVSTDRGIEVGVVVSARETEQGADSKMRKALRKATERDLYLFEKKNEREESAYSLCRKRIKTQKLPMKLSGVECVFDKSRVILYFTANERVDFRELVKDLARRLRTRIEMRQIGARDEAKLIGGLGCCGLGQNCSALFLKELKSVSVRTVKQQDLGMSLNRLSGMCGRLKCCLNFEVEGRKRTPCESGGCGKPAN